MSATTELLTEKIQLLELQLETARNSDNKAEITRLVIERDRIKAQLLTASKNLNESAQLLKG